MIDLIEIFLYKVLIVLIGILIVISIFIGIVMFSTLRQELKTSKLLFELGQQECILEPYDPWRTSGIKLVCQ